MVTPRQAIPQVVVRWQNHRTILTSILSDLNPASLPVNQFLRRRE
jgi:hypothetical protein